MKGMVILIQKLTKDIYKTKPWGFTELSSCIKLKNSRNSEWWFKRQLVKQLLQGAVQYNLLTYYLVLPSLFSCNKLQIIAPCNVKRGDFHYPFPYSTHCIFLWAPQESWDPCTHPVCQCPWQRETLHWAVLLDWRVAWLTYSETYLHHKGNCSAGLSTLWPFLVSVSLYLNKLPLPTTASACEGLTPAADRITLFINKTCDRLRFQDSQW